ncbi:CCCH zinc finger protein [Histoplasma capsulatum G186AR]|uniref:CCCH zinc finger protein n=2 Tax=Ajellomyces capsulatus TaxID=5037 RepID=C0NFX1_AJECG|nr:CCCH zinc finger protein [Histoplasma capsulatum G186AR]EEH10142.1 CCCH zinc finger protein [Histoplasma capsulatum G186AR]KAG5290904.1 CCCH zinc finger protein [Histoplasma capsulatum]QSS72831.1 CCCH zinc finger protein [Histoplasma capsulatum G186AR]
MGSGGFSFPPPPPPPPQTGLTSFPGAPYSQSQGGRGSGGHQRGRGRGSAHRGGKGNRMNGPSHGPSHNMNFTPASVNRYHPHPHAPHPHAPPNNPLPPQYNPQGPAAHYAPPPQGQADFPSAAPYTRPSPHLPPQQNTYSQPVPIQYPPRHPASHPAAYSPPAPMHRHSPSPNRHPQPHIMPPPIHWGFENAVQGSAYPPPDSRAPQYGYPDKPDSKPHHPPRPPHDRHASRPSQEYNSFSSTNQFNRGDKFANRNNKRSHSGAFGGSQMSNTRPTAPLPIPSFGLSLPSKPPPSVDATRKHKKKKRTHNQLGLTPLTEEHESSEEEDDVDEETKLSQTVSTGELKFTYKGQTSTLQTPTDIAAWIEERKKRYPTRARVEERLREAEAKKQAAKEAREAKRAKENATRQQKNMDQEEARRPLKEARLKKDKYKSDKIALKEEQKQPLDPADAAAKAKLKAEKLRRKLMKEEKRVARAEADAEKARLRAEASKAQTNGVLDGEAKPAVTPTSAAEYAPSSASCDTSKPAPTEIEDTQPDDQIDAGSPQQEQPTSHLESTIHTDPVQAAITGPATIRTQQETPNTMEHTPHVNGNVPPTAVTGNGLSDELDSLSSFSDNDSELDDETSSSGSDSSEEDDTSSSEPEQATTRREQPERVLPPARQPKTLCRQFAKTGQCRRGNRCRFLHQAPDKTKNAMRPSAPVQDKKGRKSLFQTLVSREKEEEDRTVMKAISWLGQRGVLAESATDTVQDIHEEPSTT